MRIIRFSVTVSCWILLTLLFCAPPALAVTWSPLIDRLVADGFSRQELTRLFTDVAYSPTAMGHKMHSLYVKKYGSGLVRELQRTLQSLGYAPGKADGFSGSKTRAAIRGFQKTNGLEVDGYASEKLLAFMKQKGLPAPKGYTPPPPPEKGVSNVYKSILTAERLSEAEEFYNKHLPLLKDIQRQYGITPDVAVGLLTVETRVGRFLGDQPAFQTLACMARSTEPSLFASEFKRESPKGAALTWLRKRTRQKADWAYDELKALLRYAANKGADPRTIPCSIYGAIGICQFMPSNALKFGVDGNQDGIVNLFDVDDALHSMGNYLNAHGWRDAGTSERQQRKALYNYNHSTTYVNTIMAVAKHLRAATVQ